ncbi:MAG: ribonuclease HII [bacterium]
MKNKQKYPHNFFEKLAWEKNFYVCGLDEAGRGALAGPVVAAAVILPIKTKQNFLKDSKIMSKQERDRAYQWITQHCHYAAAISCYKTIDAINIYQATLQAMKKAFIHVVASANLNLQNLQYVLTNAMPMQMPSFCRHDHLQLHYFNYGESVSSSIAAASIVAKVTRDRIMNAMAHAFPAFAFDIHKGYGTQPHTDILAQKTPSIIHRKTFLIKIHHRHEAKQQLTLF